ncbi:MAG: hypothetical protein ACP5QS_08130 [bacterium]
MWGKERTEFEKAIEKLLNEYDTADWENRFVVGGAMEVLFCALVNSLGFSSKWLAGNLLCRPFNGLTNEKNEIESKHLLNGLSKLAISGEERND